MNVDTNAARDLCEELGYLHGSGPERTRWLRWMRRWGRTWSEAADQVLRGKSA